MLALVRSSISSARLIATAARCATARAISASSSPNARWQGRAAHSSPTRWPPGRQRRHQQVGDRRVRPQRCAAGSSAAAVEPGEHHLGRGQAPAAPERVRERCQQRGRRRRPRAGTAGRRRRPAAAVPSTAAGRARRRRRRPRPAGRAPTGRSARRPGDARGRTAARSRSRPRRARRCASAGSACPRRTRAARVWSTITPIVSPGPRQDRNGRHRLERSSSSSGTYFIRGSCIACSRMNWGGGGARPSRSGPPGRRTDLADRLGEHGRGGTDRQLRRPPAGR